jgi:hypothetical protein
MLIILPGSVNFKHFEGKMEGYLEIFEGNFVEKKEISGYGEGNYFFGSGNTVLEL